VSASARTWTFRVTLRTTAVVHSGFNAQIGQSLLLTL
jgi:hypothetical protein